MKADYLLRIKNNMKAKIKLTFCSSTKQDNVVIIPIDEEKTIELMKACLQHDDSFFEILVDER